MMKQLGKVIAFLLIFILGLSGLYQIFSWKETSGENKSSVQALYEIGDKDRVDVVFIGPSFTYSLANPAILWDDYGIASFNLGVSGQDTEAAYTSILEVLKTQTPEVVMVDFSATMTEGYQVESNRYRNMLAYRLSKENYELIDKLTETFDEKKDFLLRWPIVHTRYKELQRYDFEQYMPSIYTLGFCYDWTIMSWMPDFTVLYSKEQTPISPINQEFVDKIVALSQERGFSVVFYLPALDRGEDTQRIFNGVEAYMDEIGVTYLDFARNAAEIGIDYQTDFIDHGHSNYTGAKKLTDYIGRFLAENFRLEDHRGEPDYEPWELCSLYQSHLLAMKNVQTLSEPADIAEILVNMDQLVIVASLEGDFLSSDRDLARVYDTLGLYGGEYEDGGTWVIQDGELTDYIPRDTLGEVHIRVNSADTVSVFRMETEEGTNVKCQMGGLPYNPLQPNASGLYLMAYDKFTNEVIVNSWFR